MDCEEPKITLIHKSSAITFFMVFLRVWFKSKDKPAMKRHIPFTFTV